MTGNGFAIRALHEALQSANSDCVTVDTFTLERYERVVVHGFYDPAEAGDIWGLLVLMLGSRFKVEQVEEKPDSELDGWREYTAILKVSKS